MWIRKLLTERGSLKHIDVVGPRRGVAFLSLNASEFVEMFVGVGASRVRDLFSQVCKAHLRRPSTACAYPLCVPLRKTSFRLACHN